MKKQISRCAVVMALVVGALASVQVVPARAATTCCCAACACPSCDCGQNCSGCGGGVCHK